jgi:ubiquinone/menaquinone biosynthesis C-methylase UbiE
VSSRSYFDAVASEWDSLRTDFFSERVREVALEALEVKSGSRAADVGAGTGFMTEALLDRGLTVVAVDESPEMLSVLRRKLADAAVDCRVCDGQSLPLEDESVDYAVANMYLHHVSSPADAISEIMRIVRPGGGVAITDLDAHEFEFLREEHHDRWLGFSRDDVQRWLQAAGAVDVDIRSAGTTCEATSASAKTHASINIFVALARQRPSAEAVDWAS